MRNDRMHDELTPELDPMQQPAVVQGYRPLAQWAWWALFGVATYLLSLVFQTFKLFTVETTWGSTGLFLAAILGLCLVMAILAFDSYAKERSRGNIHNPIPLFEWVFSRFIVTMNGKGVLQ